LEIRPVRVTDVDASRLIEEVQAEYTIRYGSPDRSPLDAAMLAAPRGAFFVGYVDGTPAAMGGWRFRSGVSAFGRTRPAEIKRMYVAAAARRTGLATQMLEHLETTAGAAGADLMVLETGIEQPEAIALYERHGYEPVTRFGYYKWSSRSRHLGKSLPGSLAAIGS